MMETVDWNFNFALPKKPETLLSFVRGFTQFDKLLIKDIKQIKIPVKCFILQADSWTVQ